MQVVRSGPMICLEALESLLKVWKNNDLDFPLSGKRVSNTWVTYLLDGDTNWKRLLIPNVIYGLKKPLKLR